MKPIDKPDPERDRQMDAAGQIFSRALSACEDDGIEREPLYVFLLLTAANVTIDDIDALSPGGEVLMREAFVKEAGDAFDTAVRELRAEAPEQAGN